MAAEAEHEISVRRRLRRQTGEQNEDDYRKVPTHR
jgi:hypothetical protein